MERKKLAKKILFLIVFIFLLNLLAHKLHLYVSIWYFDMIMHTLGGIWLALALIFVFSINNFSRQNFLKVIFGVLLVGLAWELFEFGVDEIILKNPLNTGLDTLSDLFCDITGGILGFIYYFRNSLKSKFKL